jgi:hypothetical protein
MKPRIVKCLKWMALVLAVLSIAYVIALIVTSRKVRQAYQALERDHRPMRADDIIPPRIEDTLNAALLYNSAIALLKSEPVGTSSLLAELGDHFRNTPPDESDPNTQAEMMSLLNHPTVDQAIDLVERGTQKWGCRFDLNYEDGVQVNLSHLADFRKLTVILLARAEAEAAAGHPDRAWHLTQMSLHFAEGLREEPLLINQLVRSAIIRRTGKTMRTLCRTSPPTDAIRAALDAQLVQLEDVTPLVRAMDGERLLFGEWFYTKSARELGPSLGEIDEHIARWIYVSYTRLLRPIFHLDHALYLRTLHYFTEALEPSHVARKEDGGPEASWVQRVEQSPRIYILYRLLAPALERIRVLHKEALADLRLTRLGLGLLQHRQVQGTFPETLEPLLLKTAADPFTGEPMRYQRQPSGFLLYSLGPDGQDDGGAEKAKGRDDWDIVWEFNSK